MRSSAILTGLLIILFFFQACEKDQLADPWEGLYGTYIGTTGYYESTDSSAEGIDMPAWVKITELRKDTISILPSGGSQVSADQPVPSLLVWNNICRFLDDCSAGKDNVTQLVFSDHIRQTGNYKYASTWFFLSKGMVSHNSAIRSELVTPHSGLETFGEREIYCYELRKEINPGLNTEQEYIYKVLIFKGRMQSDSPEGGSWRSSRLWGQEKHYTENVTPAS